MTKNKLKSIDVSKYTVTDTGQVLKMNKEVEVIQRPTYAELEKEKCELLGIIQGKDEVIKDLEWQIKQILEDNESYQKENAELKAYNEKLLDGDIEKHNKIVEMGKENSRLKQIILGNEMEIAAKDETIEDLFETNQRLKIELDTPVYDKLDKAKELIKRLIKETYGEGWNYSLQVKAEAEKFLKELEQ